jgi:hypothetical protein
MRYLLNLWREGNSMMVRYLKKITSREIGELVAEKQVKVVTSKLPRKECSYC